MIAIDAVFTPVFAAYTVEPCRVGQRTDFEKLVLDVKTDGTIAPEEAVHIATELLQKHFNMFASELFIPQIEQELETVNETPTIEPVQVEKTKIAKILNTSVRDIELSQRSLNCFSQANINLVHEFVCKTEEELLKLPNFGKKSLEELKEFNRNNGLTFGMNVNTFLKDGKPPTLDI